MRIDEVALFRLSIPFRGAFEHSSARRSETESLWVRVALDCGASGHGESCPRTYVTGESVEDAAPFFGDHRDSIFEITSVSDLRAWVEENREDIDRNPAAWCALELAILDALGVSSGRSVESLLGLDELAGEFRYTAVVGVQDGAAFRKVLSQYGKLGMRDFKLKLSGSLREDCERLEVLRSEGEVETLRLDANNLWESRGEAAHYLESLGGGFFAVEEPLVANRYSDLLWLAQRLGVRIVLDESFLRPRQLEELPEPRERFLLNVRVSKMGGLFRSLEVVRAAEKAGIPLVVGAQVGEASLLTRAALVVAREAGGLLAGQEGAFGTRLLVEDVSDPPLMFGDQGGLRAPDPGPGFGLSPSDVSRFLSPIAGLSR